MQTEITPEIVKDLYTNYKDKFFFISVFGTTKFHLVSQETLIRMYKFLNEKHLRLDY